MASALTIIADMLAAVKSRVAVHRNNACRALAGLSTEAFVFIERADEVSRAARALGRAFETYEAERVEVAKLLSQLTSAHEFIFSNEYVRIHWEVEGPRRRFAIALDYDVPLPFDTEGILGVVDGSCGFTATNLAALNLRAPDGRRVIRVRLTANDPLGWRKMRQADLRREKEAAPATASAVA